MPRSRERDTLLELVDSVFGQQHLDRLTDADLADLLVQQVWVRLPPMSGLADLIDEVIDRIRSRGALATELLRYQEGGQSLRVGDPEEPLETLLSLHLPEGGFITVDPPDHYGQRVTVQVPEVPHS